jgi:MFS family permease
MVAIPAAPFFGYIIDRFGRSLMFLIVACVMQVGAHIVFLLISLDIITLQPAIVMVWIGVGYSIFAAAIWPLLPFVIKENMLGTGFGTMTAIQNAGLAIGPQMIGGIQSSPKIQGTTLEYIVPLFIFITCAGIAFIFTVILITVDKVKTGGILNKTGLEKQKYREEVLKSRPN